MTQTVLTLYSGVDSLRVKDSLVLPENNIHCQEILHLIYIKLHIKGIETFPVHKQSCALTLKEHMSAVSGSITISQQIRVLELSLFRTEIKMGDIVSPGMQCLMNSLKP